MDECNGCINIANNAPSSIIRVICGCCDDTAGDGTNVPGTNDSGDPYADGTPMNSDENSIPADDMGGETGWIGDTLFSVRCCSDTGTIEIKWNVDGIINLTRNDVPIFTSTGTEREFTETYTLTGDTIYRLTAPNGVDKRVLLKPGDCQSCAPVYRLVVNCDPADPANLILSVSGLLGTETVIFFRNATQIATGLIESYTDTPGAGSWTYSATIDGVEIFAENTVDMPGYCDGGWSPWYLLDSRDFEGPDGPDRSSYWLDSGGNYAKRYCESGVSTPPLVSSGRLTQFEMYSTNFQPSTGDNALFWYDGYGSVAGKIFAWYGNGNVFDFNGENIAGFRLQCSAVFTTGTQPRPAFTCYYRYKL